MKVPEPHRLPSGSWFIQLRLNGVSVPVTADTKKDCIRQAELIKAEHRSGKREIRKASVSPPLSAVLDSYIDARRSVLSPSTIRGYMVIRRNRFAFCMDTPVADIPDWQHLIDREYLAGVSAKTLKNSWSLVASALEYAGYPVPKVRLPQLVPASRPWLDADQILRFVQAVHGLPCEIPALLALHSLRRSELIALTWDKVDLRSNRITVEGSAVLDADGTMVYKETNKSRNSRRVVPIMIPALRSALAGVPVEERTGYVVTCNPNIIWYQINRTCRDVGLPEVGVHGLRHSFASLAHHVGLPEDETMLIGGWEDAQTMHKIYTHIAEADRLKAENLMSEFYSRELSSEKC